MFFINLVKPQLRSSRFRLIVFIAFLYFLCRTLAKRPIQKRDSLHFGKKNSSNIKLMDEDSSSNGCSCLARVLDASKFDDKLININYDNFPEYIFMTFFVDGLFTQATSRKYSGKKETAVQKKVGLTGLPASTMVKYLQESISIFHEKSCVVVRTNNASLFKNSRNMLVLDNDVSILPSYTSTKIAEQQKFYDKIFSATLKKDTVLIYLDPDMLLVNTLDYLRKEASTFDVAITVREYVKMPINAGFFAISGKADQVLVDNIFSDMINISKNLSTVFADQIALLSVFKCKGYRRIHRVTSASGLKVLCLPASLYNASPRDIHTKISKSTKILHFKGDRKLFQGEVRNLLVKQKSSKAALQFALKI